MEINGGIEKTIGVIFHIILTLLVFVVFFVFVFLPVTMIRTTLHYLS
jgi:hypothetical protein